MLGCCDFLHSLYSFFTSFQVELRGHYSVERIKGLDKYFLTTSTLRALFISVLSPLPCLFMVVLVDSVSLAPPEAGSSANMAFWGRNYVSVILMTFAILQQIRVFLPGLRMTMLDAVIIPIIPSACGVAFTILMAEIVGFPVPYTLVVGVLPWFITLALSFVVCFGRALRQNAVLRKELIDFTNVQMSPIFLHFVYPVYLYGFTQVGAVGQNVYLGLLTLIKVIARNVMSYYLGTKYDLLSQVVVFDVDVFNAVYLSNSMQRSKSMSTMFVVFAIDACLAWVSINDIRDLMKNVVVLQRQIPNDHPMKHANCIEVALQITKEDHLAAVHLSQHRYRFGFATSKISPVGDVDASVIGPMAAAVKSTKFSKQILPSRSAVLPGTAVEMFTPDLTGDDRNLEHIFPERTRHELVQRTAQVLFATEFIIIIFYTKVVVPFIFATSTTARFFMSNRAYYPQLKDLSDADFKTQMSTVAILGVAQLVIVSVASFVIQRRLGIPLLHLLSFVLDHGRALVQANLFLPIFYTVQHSLAHNGRLAFQKTEIPHLLTILMLHTYIVSASATFTTLFGRSDFHHQVTLDNSFSPLEYLATFDLENDGTFEIKFDVQFSVDTIDDGDDRVMLYLLACDEKATALLNLPVNASVYTNDTSVPSYCAMTDRTLDYYCQSFPLENESTDKLSYHSSKTISGSVNNVTTQPEFISAVGSNSTRFTFYIDACELVGGDEGILRSCLEHPPPVSHTYYSSCFYCPENYPNRTEAEHKRWSEECVIPPPIWEPVEGIVAMELCTADGHCMWDTDTYLVGFYAASTILWASWGLLWLWHMAIAPVGAVVVLHYKLLTVPMTQVVYTALSFAAKHTAGQFASPNFNVVAIAALVAQVVALAVSGEVLLFIAGGWGITQVALDRIDVFRIRCVVVEWALAFVVLKQLEVNNIGIAVIWGISWFSIMFLMHYYATENLKMLRLRYRIGGQVNIDTSPVMWKGTLFLNYRRLQKGFLFLATIAALTGSDNCWRIWEWITVQGHEVLMFLLYAALAYICRCQQFRFSELESLEIDVDAGTEGTAAAGAQDNDPVSSANVIPVIEEPVVKLKKVATALILNPDKSIMLGTAYALEKAGSSGISLNKEGEVRTVCNPSDDANSTTTESAS